VSEANRVRAISTAHQIAGAIGGIEAAKALSIEGPNAEARKARLSLELADDARYLAALARRRALRERLMGAEMRAELCRQRCRLLRAALRVDGGVE